MLEDDAHNSLKCPRRRAEAGFSLSEMLVVLAFIGITVGIGIPLVNEQLRIADVRTSADQMAVHLRAARMIAVSHHKNIVVTVSADPINTISYEGTNGETRLMTLPRPVKIKAGSTASITFRSDGSTGAASTVTTESAVSSAVERWTLTVNLVGLVSVAHVRI